MIRCFWNFFKAFCRITWARWRGYRLLADQTEGLVRWALCHSCPYFDGAQCQKCCCLAEAKILITVESCPDGRWKSIWRKT